MEVCVAYCFFVLNQFAKNGKRVVMMGDDTWIQLYPEHFNKSYPYPSFNVKDLDTVCHIFGTILFLVLQCKFFSSHKFSMKLPVIVFIVYIR